MGKRNLILFFFLGLAIQFLNAQGLESKNSKTDWDQNFLDKLSEKVEAYRQLTHTPGLALAIIQNGDIIERSFYGFADVERQIPISEKSEFWLASISKHLTSSLILDLEEDGILSRDDFIIKYIPTLPESWNDIKIKHLMSHTSGILDNSYNNREETSFMDLINAYAPNSPSIDEFISLLKGINKSLEAGAEVHYSDIGMMVLAIVASKASKKPFNQLMGDRIFKPAQMSAYLFYPTENPNQVTGYTWTNWELQEDNNRNSVLKTDQREYGGAGSLFVTLDDMINWNKALNENTILKSETKKLLWEKYKLNSGEEIDRGLGLNYKQYPGGYAVGHNGIAGTEYWKFPEQNIDIIILTNHGMNLASYGFISLVANELGLLNAVNPEILLNSLSVTETSMDSNCLPSGKFKIKGPFPTEAYIEFYINEQSPNVMVQGLNFELKPLKDCKYIGYSKAVIFPGFLIPYFEFKDNAVNWIMGSNKLPLTRIKD